MPCECPGSLHRWKPFGHNRVGDEAGAICARQVGRCRAMLVAAMGLGPQVARLCRVFCVLVVVPVLSPGGPDYGPRGHRDERQRRMGGMGGGGGGRGGGRRVMLMTCDEVASTHPKEIKTWLNLLAIFLRCIF